MLNHKAHIKIKLLTQEEVEVEVAQANHLEVVIMKPKSNGEIVMLRRMKIRRKQIKRNKLRKRKLNNSNLKKLMKTKNKHQLRRMNNQLNRPKKNLKKMLALKLLPLKKVQIKQQRLLLKKIYLSLNLLFLPKQLNLLKISKLKHL